MTFWGRRRLCRANVLRDGVTVASHIVRLTNQEVSEVMAQALRFRSKRTFRVLSMAMPVAP